MSDPIARPFRRQSLPEFIAMLALIFAVIAFSIDSMLPALPEIAAALTPGNVNRAQLVLTSFVGGLGLGLFVGGPLSDALGRKPVIIAGFALYALAAVAAVFADSLELLLAARFVQGIGAAAPRIVALAMVRDLYQGREMARITSFVMMIFILVPAVAPSIGAVIIHFVGWRGVFGSFVVLALIGSLWLNLRCPETLPEAVRRPLNLRSLAAAAREVMGNRQVQLVTVVMTLGFGQMFALLSSAQQLFSDTYGKGESFPLWFAAMALLSGSGTVLNARYVMRLGMRRIVGWAYGMQVLVSGVMSVLVFGDLLPEALRFPAFFFWAVSVFFMAGVTFGNLNAMALQRMGHVAGMAASVIGALSTLGAVLIAAPVGLLYDGTARPIVLATLVCSALALALMRHVREH
ncbi:MULTISPECIES: multidrug effflux MFS transporter [Paracoccus]|jgi:DHA1 family bicyclomycin/chloramphenicol resistance-like MFS transporter|uniref:Bcr/CflA family efflux transporter n=1 Tax=Paracoccus denitrificans (strain Pd 1222) TaxID=318586 RepID=A1B2Y1_PARDP|nr:MULTISPECIES: multidrug effflux MFS transporter [Paracoccus]ABL69875.1 drug resistance transporter, Bcr/CflA subfamily [Paracoccus denitrificans PD1222]MBB4626956.1 DHA1 family bicyclomycin/chloramphenicol resistance-like MFS transporter [Paracoccus denitrificans]MCU7428344.1 multidrug effflux MFS transporter [Paracoccus denitrificans]UPV94153.1 multidrug effflux MFS transporter [Paracoccus denitrificans]WQO33806.1 multidrug effflux MFS transporter [Paracoccus denitrificans]